MENKSTENEQIEAFQAIIQACSVLGWTVSFKNDDDEADIEYMIIGTPANVDAIVNKIEG